MTNTETPDTESHLRSVLKGLTWRVIATSTLITIAYVTTEDISLALELGFYEFFIKLVVYYLHERAWLLVPKGSIRKLNPFK